MSIMRPTKSLVARALGGLLRLGLRGGLRSIEIDPEEFRHQLSEKHGLLMTDRARLKDVPVERLDAIAEELINEAGRRALLGGAGFGLGGIVTIIPDASFLSITILRLMQRLALLYGFEEPTRNNRMEMWKAAASAAGIDYGKEFVEKQLCEKVAPRFAQRLAVRVGTEAAEKWVGRVIPLAGSAIGGALNYTFVRTWGRRAQRQLRARRLAGHTSGPRVCSSLGSASLV